MKPISPKDAERLLVNIRTDIKEAQKIDVDGKLTDKELLDTIIGYVIMYGGNLELIAPIVMRKNKYVGMIVQGFGWAIKKYAKHIKVKTKKLL